jgi:hypothetical protein
MQPHKSRPTYTDAPKRDTEDVLEDLEGLGAIEWNSTLIPSPTHACEFPPSPSGAWTSLLHVNGLQW